jgi:diadenylate cyclase
MIIREGRIYAAGCFLPLSTQEIDLDFGTRHRAGLGMSENSDAMVIIISEETGNITIAQSGTLKKCNNISKLKAEIKKQLLPETDEKNTKKLTERFFKKRTEHGSNEVNENKEA